MRSRFLVALMLLVVSVLGIISTLRHAPEDGPIVCGSNQVAVQTVNRPHQHAWTCRDTAAYGPYSQTVQVFCEHLVTDLQSQDIAPEVIEPELTRWCP